MEFINTVLGTPLGLIIYLAYQLTDNYGLAILIFTVIVRIVVFPVNVLAHKNSIRLLQLQPGLSIINRRYAGDKERLNEERHELFKKEQYSPFVGMVPLLVQLVLVMGMLQVMYHPLQHMLRLDANVIGALVGAVRGIYGDVSVFGEQLAVLDALRSPENLAVFQAALAGFDNAQGILDMLARTELGFLSINLGAVPSLANPSRELLIVLFSGLATLLFCMVQYAISPGAMSQGKKTNLGLIIFTVALGIYFAAVTPAGVGMYWAVTSLLSIGAVMLLNVLFSPIKLAGDAIAYVKANRKTRDDLRADRERNKALSEREKSDAARFTTAKKQLVFYAISGGQFKYYKTLVEYILTNSDVKMHYITNDPEDPLFKQDDPKLIPYYIGQRRTVSLMLKLSADILVSTVPDLQAFQWKRSIARDDIEYIYTYHGLTSGHLVLREKAFDHFDTVFCVGPHHAEELRRREEMAGLRRKNLVKTGYGVYDQMASSYADVTKVINEKPRILIAPSWQKDNIMELCIDDILDALLGKDYKIVIRPHPQFIRMFPERIEELKKKYFQFISDGELEIEEDFSGNSSVFLSDALLTDWSNIAYEFSYCTLKPSIFINTPMKIMNPNYERYGLEVLDISLRDKIGVSVDVADVSNLDMTVSKVLREKDAYKEQIEGIVNQYIYHPGRSGEAGGRYIINRLKEKGRSGE